VRLTEPLVEAPLGFGPGLELDVTTTFLGAVCPLASPSRGRLEPEISLRAPFTTVAPDTGGLAGEPSFEPGFPFSCLRLVDAAALACIVCARAFTSALPFFANLGSTLATFVLVRVSSSMVMNRASSLRL
jgi:hypothetical protein